VQRNGRKVREMVESETSVTAKYVSPDLTILAEHITEGEIIQTAYSQQPDNVYYAVTGNGTLSGMTYERDQQVIGWSRSLTPGASGNFESVAVIYGDTGDEVWTIVNRTIGNDTKRYIERFNPVKWEDKEDAFYVDSGISVCLPDNINSGNLTAGKFYRVISNEGMDMSAVGGPASPRNFQTFEATITATPVYGQGSVREVSDVFTGLDHLEGETVDVLGDGGVYENLTVTGGQVTLPNPQSVILDNKVTKAHIGLRYESVAQPMKLEADPKLGAFMATELKLRQIVVRFVKSLGLTYSTNVEALGTGTLDQIFEEIKHPMRDTSHRMDESPPLFTGDRRIAVQSRHDYDGNLVVKQTQPLPTLILAIIKKYEVTGR